MDYNIELLSLLQITEWLQQPQGPVQGSWWNFGSVAVMSDGRLVTIPSTGGAHLVS